MIAVSPRQLEVFSAIAGAGSVRVAADQLGLSQPAASMALAELERLLGAPLFDRQQRRLRLNENGRALLPRAREIVERMRELGSGAQSGGMLAVGASNTIGNYMVGDLLGPFMAQHAQVQLSLRVANSLEILSGVVDCSLDVGCIEAPITHPDVELSAWRTDELKVCVRADHALARRSRVRAEHLLGQRWILRERGSGTRAVFEQASRDLIGEPMVALELGQSEAIKQAVIAGLGIACLPRAAIADALDSGKLVALRTPFLKMTRTLSIALHRARYRGASLRAFLERCGVKTD
jgi:DNA-binding transcriptional LysR family regulator